MGWERSSSGPARLRPLALAARLAWSGAALLCALPATAQQNAPADAVGSVRRYHVAAGPLGNVLAQFAAQAGVQLSFDGTLANVRSEGIDGVYSVRDGFRRLLDNTGYELLDLQDGSYSVRRAALAASDAAAGDALPVVSVIGRRDGETGEAQMSGYAAQRGSSATKTDTPLMETPRSISVVTRDQMSDQGVQTAEQALRYTAGVLTEVTGYDLRYQSMMVRGFAPTLYRDGMRTFASGSYGDWQTDPQGLERIEVLRGPASVLYGQGSPGGMVNQISKRPTAEDINEVGLLVGNHQRYQATLDVGGQLNEDGTLLYRFNGLVRDSKTQTSYSRDNRVFLAPSLTWRPDGQTSLTLLADFTQDRMTPKSWWPDKSLLAIGSHGNIPVGTFAGEPGFDRYNRDMSSVGYLLEHQLSDDVSLRQNLRYSDFKLDYQHVFSDSWVDAADPGNPLIVRYPLISRTRGHALTIDNQFNFKAETAGIRHDAVLGLDLMRFTGEADEGYGDALPDFDPFHPVYGATIAPFALTHSTSRLWQAGLYAQDSMKLGALVVQLGIRHDRASNTYEEPANQFVTQAQDSKTTYNLGLLYKFAAGWSPFASYATSFDPALFGRTASGDRLQPETGKQYELGVKYQPPGSNAIYTATYFNLRKQNVATPDPNDRVNLVVQTGEIRSRGIELEAAAALTRQFDVVASYTYLDAAITRSNNPAEIGQRPEQTARNTAKLWLDYKLTGDLAGWRLGGGVRYVSATQAKTDTDDASLSYSNPAYTLVDAAIHYKSGPITIAMNASNLFDKVYVANRGMFYGQGRTLQTTVSYKW